MEPSEKIPAYQEEVSFKDLIIKIRLWIKYLISKWKVIALFAILFGLFGVLYALIKKPIYTAEMTFVVEEGQAGSPLAAYAGIASQFGIDLGGKMGENGIFSGDNILEFLKSRLIVEKSLLTPVESADKGTSLAELYIQSYELREKWNKKPSLVNIQFPPGTDRSKFSRQQDSLLFELYKDIVKNRLDVSKRDKKLAFIVVSCETVNEIFSKEFSERLVKEATDFYVATRIKRSRLNVNNLQVKADSIEALLNEKTYSAAVSQDLNRNPARRVALVGSELAGRDKIVLQTIFGEVVKNLEIAKMSLAQQSPIIQIVDAPIYPLEDDKTGKAKSAVAGMLLGAIVACIVLVIRKMYSALMA